jgi:hypothetical protein
LGWSSVLTEFLKFINNLFSNFGTNPQKQIEKVINIYDTMHLVLEETAVERFIIFKAHNGGGIIKPSGELYVTALYEDYTYPFHSVKSQYQKIEVDEIYARMLLDVIQKGQVHLYADEMKDGLLKGIYQSEGVHEARIFFLGQDKKFIFYCSCATSKEWLISQGEKARLELAVGKIKQNIK